jgi:hypothetical protein
MVLAETQSVPSPNVGASSHLPTAAAAVVVVAAAEQSVTALEVLAPQMMRV